jgi:VanZ family protein
MLLVVYNMFYTDLMLKKIVYYWAPALLWMMLIFILSSKQRIEVSETYFINFMFFKTGHIIEYAILNFLIFRAIYLGQGVKYKKALIYSTIISICYAASDEIHQRFIPTREGRPRDVFIDVIGIFFVYFLLTAYFNKIKKYL